MRKAVTLAWFSTLLVLGTAAWPSGARGGQDDHPDIALFLQAAAQDGNRAAEALGEIGARWRVGYAGIIWDLARFVRPPSQQLFQFFRLVDLLQQQTGQPFGGDLARWHEWKLSRPSKPLARIRRRILEMSPSGRFPDALRTSAVARWSHRDPVECGHPFSPDDFRHQAWQSATCRAKADLVRCDRELEAGQRDAAHPDPYPVRLVALVVTRFDVWAKRGLSILRDAAALQDYELWLATYTRNWLAYVAETCPKVDVGDNLRSRLAARAAHWVDEARRAETDSS